MLFTLSCFGVLETFINALQNNILFGHLDIVASEVLLITSCIDLFVDAIAFFKTLLACDIDTN